MAALVGTYTENSVIWTAVIVAKTLNVTGSLGHVAKDVRITCLATFA